MRTKTASGENAATPDIPVQLSYFDCRSVFELRKNKSGGRSRR
jgi:hypothetical protein